MTEEPQGAAKPTKKPKKDRPSSAAPSPEQGRRLVLAFMSIKSAAARDTIVDFIEAMAEIIDVE